jgi:hypothetical protein
MRRLKILCSVAGFYGLFVLGGPAFGQSPGAGSEPIAGPAGAFTLFAGVKLWATQWDVVNAQNLYVIPNLAAPNVIVQPTISKSVSKTEFVPIALIGVRVGDFVGSANYFPRTTYDSRDPSLGNVDRDEFDVTLGYAVVPNLVVSVVYKHASVNKISSQFSPSGLKIDAILVGASGSAVLIDKWSLYGNVAYGFARQKNDFLDFAGDDTYSGRYRIGEVGLSYRAYTSEQGMLKTLSISLGYRAQIYTTKSVFQPVVTPDFSVVIDPRKVDVQSTTNGFVLGIQAAF